MVGKKAAVTVLFIGHLLYARVSLYSTHETGIIISTLQERRVDLVGEVTGSGVPSSCNNIKIQANMIWGCRTYVYIPFKESVQNQLLDGKYILGKKGLYSCVQKGERVEGSLPGVAS